MKRKRHSNIPIFIPELACGHQCVFCNQANISSRPNVPSPSEIGPIIDEHLTTMNDDRSINIAFFGGSFTGIPLGLQEEYLKVAHKYIEGNKVDGIRLSTRPDYIDIERMELLKKYGVTAIELGTQSTDDFVLQKSGRGHLFSHTKTAVKIIKQYGFELGLQMMIGLPFDTYEKSEQTAKDIIELHADTTRIYPTLVVADTALEKLFKSGKYEPLQLKDAVEWSSRIAKLFYDNNVKVLRIGLHPSEDLQIGKALIAGPYHPSFNELVQTSIWNKILSDNLTFQSSNNLVIEVRQNQLNYCIGYKKQNKNEFAAKGFNLTFKINNKLKEYELNVCNS